MKLNKAIKLLGCDISAHQGIINFEQLKAKGIKCVIIRAGYGTATVDKYFVRNITNAIKLGFHIGVYWFIYAKNQAQSSSNALKFYQTIAPYLDYIDCGVWADWEYDSDTKAGYPNASMRNAIMETFLNTLEGKNLEVGIYSNKDYIRSGKFYASLIKKYPLWYAWYNKSLDLYSTKGKDNYPYIWQYTSKENGKNFGCQSTGLDMDWLYIDFDNTDKSTITPSVLPSGICSGIKEMKIKKGNVAQFGTIVENIKTVLNEEYKLHFVINSVVDDILLTNLGNIVMSKKSYNKSLTYVLQQLFTWYGFILAVDGGYGKNTENAVLVSQKAFNIEQTGTTTKEFWTKILGK